MDGEGCGGTIFSFFLQMFAKSFPPVFLLTP